MAEVLDFTALCARLAARVAEALPGPQAQRSMAPELSYGRHFGPAPGDARPAAVLALLYPSANGWTTPVTVRAEQLKVHAGQVCLPGGRTDTGESPAETALREYREELGELPPGTVLIGALSPVYVWVSNSLISPLLAVAPKAPSFTPNPSEVAAVLEVALTDLADPRLLGRHTIRRRGLVFRAPQVRVGPYPLWGATSMILAEVAALAGLHNHASATESA